MTIKYAGYAATKLQCDEFLASFFISCNPLNVHPQERPPLCH